MPLIFVASLLREAIAYDWKFPPEREAIDAQLNYLKSLDSPARTALFQSFAAISLDAQLEQTDWVHAPTLFSERLTAWLWSSHQIDAFHRAAMEYQKKFAEATPAHPPALPRMSIAVIGQGVQQASFPLFRKLRPHGVHFTAVNAAGGMETLLATVAARAAKEASPYRHWYLDGAQAGHTPAQVTLVSWDGVQSVRTALLAKMQQFIQSGKGGPELLQSTMAQMTPADLGVSGEARDPVLGRFEVSLLTEGSGTQIFSTTFVQWAAREALRRAQRYTLLAHFTPRQKQRPMNELISAETSPVEPDPAGSLIDADMGAYYIWLDQQRLTGADRSSFLVWFEGHSEALAFGPNLPRGTQSDTPATLQQLLEWMT